MNVHRVVSRLVATVMTVIVTLAVMLTAFAGTSEARTIKHRSWKGYTVCYTKHWKKVHHRKHRCFRHTSRELRKRKAAVRYAKSKLGNWYQWGGTGPYGFDCSGLIYAAYRHVGRHIPRTTYGQLSGMRGKHRGGRRIGDLVFPHRGHVAMYIGHGRVIAAPHTGARIRYESSGRYHYAVRSPF